MTEIKLQVKDGSLHYPESVVDHFGDAAPIVLCVYDEGDCNTIKWPRPNMKNLRRALLDDQETGLLPLDADVRLPNGNAVVPWCSS